MLVLTFYYGPVIVLSDVMILSVLQVCVLVVMVWYDTVTFLSLSADVRAGDLRMEFEKVIVLVSPPRLPSPSSTRRWHA